MFMQFFNSESKTLSRRPRLRVYSFRQCWSMLLLGVQAVRSKLISWDASLASCCLALGRVEASVIALSDMAPGRWRILVVLIFLIALIHESVAPRIKSSRRRLGRLRPLRARVQQENDVGGGASTTVINPQTSSTPRWIIHDCDMCFYRTTR